MALELLNTFGTLLTVAIVAATAIAALVQLRHLRAGNQINAMLSIGDRFEGPRFTSSLDLVQQHLDDMMNDPAFRTYVTSVQHQTKVPEVTSAMHDARIAATAVGNTYEELGILVRNNIIDRDLFLDRYCSVIIGAWKRLEKYCAFIRQVANDQAIWENFELIAVLSQDWVEHNPTSYPKGLRKLNPQSLWPVPEV